MDDLISRHGTSAWLENMGHPNLARIVMDEKRFPSVQPVSHWVPVTNRVPHENGFYVVSGSGKIWVCEFVTISGIHGWKNSASNPAVKAWLPIALPEPYEEVTECQTGLKAR